jgi:hypothetical protein
MGCAVSLPTGLPSFSVLSAALRSTTECLAREVISASPAAPEWSDIEWSVARAVAAMQGMSVLLANRLSWRGPPSWQSFLHAQRHQALERDVRIESLLEQLDVTLRAERVACVALKGSALRRLALYRPGERPMGDIDLLARRADAGRVARALEVLSYKPVFDTRRHRVFAPPATGSQVRYGEHAHNPLKVELHFEIAEQLPVQPVDITAGLMSQEQRSGLNEYSSVRELFRHLLLHAAGNMRAHTLRQLQLHDIALLAGRLETADWERLLETPETHGGAWWMWPVLELTRRYYTGSIPTIIDEFRMRTPGWLRRASARVALCDVSWSNLKIAAFPGLHWARSASEALQFMRSRALPERIALDELEVVPRAQPDMMQVPWYGISHGRRIIRWVFSRPPRVQTVVCVQAALADVHARQ